jgi:GT2 family glycosyltransferase
MPQVAIVIPLFNKESCVLRAVESAIAQTFTDWEMIVVDDGSTDKGPDLVAACKDPRVRLHRQKNAGPGAARNRGMELTAAPLLAFLDADDEWMPDFLQFCVEKLDANPACAVCNTGWYWGPDRVSFESRHIAQGIKAGVWRMPADIHPLALKDAVDYYHSSALVARREVVQKIGGFYEKNRCTYGEDSYLWLQAALMHPAYRDPAPRMWFHTEDSSLGFGRRSAYPVRPMLTEPEPVFDRCPAELRPALDAFLGFMAVYTARGQAKQGNGSTALSLMRRFPLRPPYHQQFRSLRLQATAWAMVAPLKNLVKKSGAATRAAKTITGKGGGNARQAKG